tara:strand:+ start:521 stop:1093 length:573 start_codon:yes stop_codon:yes gene_type:complete
MASSRVSLPAAPERLAVTQALVDSGWRGDWKLTTGGLIALDGCEGSLAQYIRAHGPLNYHQAVQLALNLGTQIVALAELGKGLISLRQDDVIVCSGFLIGDLSNTVALEGNQLEIVRAVDQHHCIAPEVEKLDTLPSVVHMSAIYYSIAVLCLECMDISREMREIQGSKLYYLLDRCLRPDPQTREFLYI